MKFKHLCIVTLLLINAACAEEEIESVDLQETGQQVGDIMASIDESGGSTGGFALFKSHNKTFARLGPSESIFNKMYSSLINKAHATTCAAANTFGTCTTNTITRDFNDCSVGTATFSGTVTLSFDDNGNNCQVNDVGEKVTRVPDFTVTGNRGAVLTVAKTGTVGQTIERTGASSFTFANDGIRRTFGVASSPLFDFTTQTITDIGISGESRASRILDSGTLQITNNISGASCEVSPNNVAWESTCNCATSGSWAGSCSDGKAFNLTITDCGSANLSVGDDSEGFTFDRCYSL